jgi:ABC-type nitrate/sulfonate/bicarbonate transport system substrate-binding protein
VDHFPGWLEPEVREEYFAMTNTLKETYFVPPVPLAVAKHLRYFEEAGLEVDSKTSRSSNQQREDLLSGERDVAVTAIDNLLIWNEGQDDFRLIAQVEQTTSLTIYARPGLQSIGDLAGTRFAVDAATNGFAMVARHLLADAGVGDVDFVEIGGVRERLSALLDGQADATLLGPPLDEMAEQAGLVKLLVANDLLGEYPGQGLVVRTSRIPELRLLLRTYLSSLSRAVDWSNRATRETGIAILRDAGFGGRSSETGWETRPSHLVPSGAGLQLLIQMRQGLDLLPASFRGIESMCDPSILQEVLGDEIDPGQQSVPAATSAMATQASAPDLSDERKN